MNKIPEYSSQLIEEIYQNIPQTTFDSVANKMALALKISEANKIKNGRMNVRKNNDL